MSKTGISALDLLTIAFIVLKLTHVIDWSWWLVLSPIWVMILLVIILIIIKRIAEGKK